MSLWRVECKVFGSKFECVWKKQGGEGSIIWVLYNFFKNKLEM